MEIEILTLFPEMFDGVFTSSMIKRAQKEGIVDIEIHNLRRWTHDNHKTCDDKPFGGGPGMVMKVEPVDEALEYLTKEVDPKPHVILLCPQGKIFDQKTARSLSNKDHVIFICGHYEGFDERIRTLVDEEISVGDYIMTCGEIPAMAVTDAVVRLLPGVLGAEDGIVEESFENGMLEYPQYTRPADYKGQKVPDILLSGDPEKIKTWRQEQSILRTKDRRPDLLKTIKEYE